MQAYSLINKRKQQQTNKTKQKKKKKKKKKKKNINTWRCLLSSYRSVSAMKKNEFCIKYNELFHFVSVGRS